ncbi:MAG: hypothetical protein HYZ67_07055, partial [Chlamydiae bacterium]|nr:hypothetical protein [Chlamydiota bacterium]
MPFFRKIISLFLCLSLSLNEAWTWAQEAPLFSHFLENFKIPHVLGETIEKCIFPGRPLLFILEDIHAQTEVQRNLEGILKALQSLNQHLNPGSHFKVFVEGAVGLMDMSFFTSFPEDQAFRMARKSFLEKNEITGAESFLMSKEGQKSEGFGVEDFDAYWKNVEWMGKLMEGQNRQENEWQSLEQTLKALRQKVYSKELRTLSEKKEAYEEGRVGIEGYVTFLSSFTGSLAPMIQKFLALKDLESRIDHGKVDQEYLSYLEVLEKKLSEEEVKELLKNILEHRLGKVRDEDHYLYLKQYDERVKGQGSGVKKFRNLELLFEQMKLLKEISWNRLQSEVKALEKQLINRWAISSGAKALIELEEDYGLLKRVVSMEGKREDIKTVFSVQRVADREDRTGVIDLRHFVHRLKILAQENDVAFEDPDLYETFQMASHFYEQVLKRDGIFCEKILDQMKDEKNSCAAFVVGGFHADGLKERLKEAKIGYWIVAPRFVGRENRSFYFQKMKEKFEEREVLKKTLSLPAQTNEGIATDRAVFEKAHEGFARTLVGCVLRINPQRLDRTFFGKWEAGINDRGLKGMILKMRDGCLSRDSSAHRSFLGKNWLQERKECNAEILTSMSPDELKGSSRTVSMQIPQSLAAATRHGLGEALSEAALRDIADESQARPVEAGEFDPILNLLSEVQSRASPENRIDALKLNELVDAVRSGIASGQIEFYHQPHPYRPDLAAFARRGEHGRLRIYLSGDLAISSEGEFTLQHLYALVGFFHEAHEQITLARQYPSLDPRIRHRMAVYDEARLMQTLQGRLPSILRHPVLSPLTVHELWRMDDETLSEVAQNTALKLSEHAVDFESMPEYHHAAEAYTRAVEDDEKSSDRRGENLNYVFSSGLGRSVQTLALNLGALRRRSNVGDLVMVLPPTGERDPAQVYVRMNGSMNVSFPIDSELSSIFAFHRIYSLKIPAGFQAELIPMVAAMAALKNLERRLRVGEGIVFEGGRIWTLERGSGLTIRNEASTGVLPKLFSITFNEIAPRELSAVEWVRRANTFMEEGKLSSAKLVLDRVVIPEVERKNGRYGEGSLTRSLNESKRRLKRLYEERMAHITEFIQSGSLEEARVLLQTLSPGFSEDDGYVLVRDQLTRAEEFTPEIFARKIAELKRNGIPFKKALLQKGFASPQAFLEAAEGVGLRLEAGECLIFIIRRSYEKHLGRMREVRKDLGFTNREMKILYALISLDLRTVNFHIVSRLQTEVEALEARGGSYVLFRAVKSLGFESLEAFVKKFKKEELLWNYLRDWMRNVARQRGADPTELSDYLGVSEAFFRNTVESDQARRLGASLQAYVARYKNYKLRPALQEAGFENSAAFLKAAQADSSLLNVVRDFFISVLESNGGNVPYCAVVMDLPKRTYLGWLARLKIEPENLSYHEGKRLRNVLSRARQREIFDQGKVLSDFVPDQIQCFHLPRALAEFHWADFKEFAKHHGKREDVKSVLRDTFEDVLGLTNGRRVLAARLLGLSYETLTKWMEAVGMEVEEAVRPKEETGLGHSVAAKLRRALERLPEGSPERLDLALQDSELHFGGDMTRDGDPLRAFMTKYGRDPEVKAILTRLVVHAMEAQGGFEPAAAARLGITTRTLSEYYELLDINKKSLSYDELSRFKRKCEELYSGGIPNIKEVVLSLGYTSVKGFMTHELNRENRELMGEINRICKAALDVTKNFRRAAEVLGVSAAFVSEHARQAELAASSIGSAEKISQVIHMSAEVKEGLPQPGETCSLPGNGQERNIYEVLNHKSITVTMTDGEVTFSQSDALAVLEEALGIEPNQREKFYEALEETIRNREKLKGRKKLSGTFTLYLGDVETSRTELEKEAYRTLFGNHKKDHQLYCNIRALLNIQNKTHRRALFLTGFSHEMVHELLPEKDQKGEKLKKLEKALVKEDAEILKTKIKKIRAFVNEFEKICQGDLIHQLKQNLPVKKHRNFRFGMIGLAACIGLSAVLYFYHARDFEKGAPAVEPPMPRVETTSQGTNSIQGLSKYENELFFRDVLPALKDMKRKMPSRYEKYIERFIEAFQDGRRVSLWNTSPSQKYEARPTVTTHLRTKELGIDYPSFVQSYHESPFSLGSAIYHEVIHLDEQEALFEEWRRLEESIFTSSMDFKTLRKRFFSTSAGDDAFRRDFLRFVEVTFEIEIQAWTRQYRFVHEFIPKKDWGTGISRRHLDWAMGFVVVNGKVDENRVRLLVLQEYGLYGFDNRQRAMFIILLENAMRKGNFPVFGPDVERSLEGMNAYKKFIPTDRAFFWEYPQLMTEVEAIHLSFPDSVSTPSQLVELPKEEWDKRVREIKSEYAQHPALVEARKFAEEVNHDPNTYLEKFYTSIVKGLSKGVLFPSYWLASLLIKPVDWIRVRQGKDPLSKDFKEDWIVPWIEDGVMFALWMWLGDGAYVGVRTIFILPHGLQKHENIDGKPVTLWEKVALPIRMSVVSLMGVLSLHVLAWGGIFALVAVVGWGMVLRESLKVEPNLFHRNPFKGFSVQKWRLDALGLVRGDDVLDGENRHQVRTKPLIGSQKPIKPTLWSYYSSLLLGQVTIAAKNVPIISVIAVVLATILNLMNNSPAMAAPTAICTIVMSVFAISSLLPRLKNLSISTLSLVPAVAEIKDKPVSRFIGAAVGLGLLLVSVLLLAKLLIVVGPASLIIFLPSLVAHISSNRWVTLHPDTEFGKGVLGGEKEILVVPVKSDPAETEKAVLSAEVPREEEGADLPTLLSRASRARSATLLGSGEVALAAASLGGIKERLVRLLRGESYTSELNRPFVNRVMELVREGEYTRAAFLLQEGRKREEIEVLLAEILRTDTSLHAFQLLAHIDLSLALDAFMRAFAFRDGKLDPDTVHFVMTILSYIQKEKLSDVKKGLSEGQSLREALPVSVFMLARMGSDERYRPFYERMKARAQCFLEVDPEALEKNYAEAQMTKPVIARVKQLFDIIDEWTTAGTDRTVSSLAQTGITHSFEETVKEVDLVTERLTAEYDTALGGGQLMRDLSDFCLLGRSPSLVIRILQQFSKRDRKKYNPFEILIELLCVQSPLEVATFLYILERGQAESILTRDVSSLRSPRLSVGSEFYSLGDSEERMEFVSRTLASLSQKDFDRALESVDVLARDEKLVQTGSRPWIQAVLTSPPPQAIDPITRIYQALEGISGYNSHQEFLISGVLRVEDLSQDERAHAIGRCRRIIGLREEDKVKKARDVNVLIAVMDLEGAQRQAITMLGRLGATEAMDDLFSLIRRN